VPESDTHDVAIEYLRALLLAWAARSGRSLKIARNLGIRWVQREPRAGFDPDLCVIEPAPPVDVPLTSLRLWEPGHTPPLLAIEIVSPGHPYKDYVDTPDRCAASGVGELWVYDPMLKGPKAHGGPHLLQIWRRSDAGAFERCHAGSGPAYSPALEAWLHPNASQLPSAAQLVIAGDSEGRERWLTTEETERALRKREHALREQERVLREQERVLREREHTLREQERREHQAECAAFEARIAELEAKLRQR
jgi:Uma2 family endonuclease